MSDKSDFMHMCNSKLTGSGRERENWSEWLIDRQTEGVKKRVPKTMSPVRWWVLNSVEQEGNFLTSAVNCCVIV